jgi:Ca-activated chloride channel family protein
LNGKLSHPYVAVGSTDLFATLEIHAVDVPQAQRAPVNLALVIDRSGSMSGIKIAQARKAALRLVDLLTSNDRLAVVHYGSDVRFLAGALGTEENKERMRRYIRAITDEGGTNIAQGLAVGEAQLAAARSAFTVHRLLLLSDGQPTVGVTSEAGLTQIATRLRAAGTTLTALGVGADFNEDLMYRLSVVGGGSYGFIKDAESTVALFEKDLTQAGTMVARNVSLSFQLPPHVDFQEVFGRTASVNGRVVTLSLPDFSARQTEKFIVHLKAHVTLPKDVALEVSQFRLAYTDLLKSQAETAKVKLSTWVTDDSSVAEHHQDKEVFVWATRAKASQNVEHAARAIAIGQFDDAKRLIETNAQILNEASRVTGEAAFADDLRANEEQKNVAATPPSARSPAKTQESVKSMKVESLRGYGSGASVY